jgi:hypothetical protein
MQWPIARCPRCRSDNLCARFEPIVSINLQPGHHEIQIGDLVREWYEFECMTCGLMLENDRVPKDILQIALALYDDWIKHHRPPS